MSYANKLRARANKHLALFLELNTTIKDFKRPPDPLDHYSISHRIVNLAYEHLAREARRNLEPFNPRWSTVQNLRDEFTRKLNEHFTKLQGQSNQPTQRIVESNL